MITEDYRMQVKVRNNRILSLIEHYGFENVAQFCKHHGLCQTVVWGYVNQKTLPIDVKGEWKNSILKIADALKVHPDVLFSEGQKLKALENNTAIYTFYEKDVLSLASNNPEDLMIEDQSGINAVTKKAILGTLTKREAIVIALRHGMYGFPEHTLQEVGEKLNCGRERVRQIEAKALRKLRHPSKNTELRELMGLAR